MGYSTLIVRVDVSQMTLASGRSDVGRTAVTKVGESREREDIHTI